MKTCVLLHFGKAVYHIGTVPLWYTASIYNLKPPPLCSSYHVFLYVKSTVVISFTDHHHLWLIPFAVEQWSKAWMSTQCRWTNGEVYNKCGRIYTIFWDPGYNETIFHRTKMTWRKKLTAKSSLQSKMPCSELSPAPLIYAHERTVFM